MKKVTNIRALLGGISASDITLPALQVNPDEYRKFCQYANQVFTNPFYDLLKQELVNQQLIKTVLDARDHEQEEFGRATITGILLWEDIFNKYSLEFEARFLEKPEDFNPNKGFQSVINN